MNDREKVIVGLTDSIEILSDFDTQEYTLRERQQLHGSVVAAIQDAIALLKAQEPVEPIRDINGVYYCGNCNTICVGYEVEFTHSIIKVENYCHKCGRVVKWDG